MMQLNPDHGYFFAIHFNVTICSLQFVQLIEPHIIVVLTNVNCYELALGTVQVNGFFVAVLNMNLVLQRTTCCRATGRTPTLTLASREASHTYDRISRKVSIVIPVQDLR
jgi:hypothetical protein